MKLKRYSLWVLLSGIGVALLGLLTPIICMRIPVHGGSSGIIGGMDGPTYWFILSHLYDGWPIAFILQGISVAISSGFCLLFSKTVNTYCNIRTSAISLGLSGVGALGVYCVFWWFAMAAFGEASRHPVEYPVSIALGMLCFLAFMLLIGLYFMVRRKSWSIVGVIVDVLTSILYLPSFFMIISFIHAAFNRIFGQ